MCGVAVRRAFKHEEPVLLVGETGTGKTSACQAAAAAAGQRLHIVNCNQHTEASDFLGGFRPSRCPPPPPPPRPLYLDWGRLSGPAAELTSFSSTVCSRRLPHANEPLAGMHRLADSRGDSARPPPPPPPTRAALFAHTEKASARVWRCRD